MKLIINFLFSTRLKKILIIFGVGLISRVLVNYGLEINVFKDYINYISLFYYGFMACFVVVIYDIFSVFDCFGNKMFLGGCTKSLISFSDRRVPYTFINPTVSNPNVEGEASRPNVEASNSNPGDLIPNPNPFAENFAKLEDFVSKNEKLGSKGRSTMLRKIREARLSDAESSDEYSKRREKIEKLYLRMLTLLENDTSVSDAVRSSNIREYKDLVHNNEMQLRLNEGTNKSHSDYFNVPSSSANKESLPNRQRSNTHHNFSTNSENIFSSPSAPDRSNQPDSNDKKDRLKRLSGAARKLFKNK